MQLYALEKTKWVLASEAKKKFNYTCPECGEALRLREGLLRKPHFYHLRTPLHCRQHQKSLTHLLLQYHVMRLLPRGEASMECPFPEIGRITDVAWKKKNIVFEIQCSPLSLEEAQQRNKDYKSLGVTPVWILHERRFNKRFLSAAENFLREGPCFYTNFSVKHGGSIFDQLDICRRGRRLYKSRPFRINLTQPVTLSGGILTFVGSLLERAERSRAFADWIKEIKKRYSEPKKLPIPQLKTVKRGYLSCVQTCLESLSH